MDLFIFETQIDKDRPISNKEPVKTNLSYNETRSEQYWKNPHKTQRMSWAKNHLFFDVDLERMEFPEEKNIYLEMRQVAWNIQE